MKWRTPKQDDERDRVVFALIPIDCDDGSTRWLERVRVRERLVMGVNYYFWHRLSAVPATPKVHREVYVDGAR